MKVFDWMKNFGFVTHWVSSFPGQDYPAPSTSTAVRIATMSDFGRLDFGRVNNASQYRYIVCGVCMHRGGSFTFMNDDCPQGP